MPKLCALVAYYPEESPAPSARFPMSLNVAIHFAGPQSETPNCRCYSYEGVEAGFAQENHDQYEKVSASLAWSRSLATLRKSFEIEVDLEKIWDDHVARKSSYLREFGHETADLRQWNLSPKMQTQRCQPW